MDSMLALPVPGFERKYRAAGSDATIRKTESLLVKNEKKRRAIGKRVREKGQDEVETAVEAKKEE